MAAGLTVGILVFIIAYILIKGIPNLTPSLFSFTYTTENVSLFPAMVNTITMTFLSLIIAVPFGVGSAVYLVEYARRGNRLVAAVRVTAETLSGIPPSYRAVRVPAFSGHAGLGFSILAGAVTLSIMILPVIMRTTEEALKAVPDAYREGSFGLGAGRLRTVFAIVLPAAIPGILAGVILSVGRIVGETVALIYTAGTVAQVPADLFSSGRTLSVHMYVLWNEGFNTEQSYATAVVLLVVVVGLNALSAFIARKIARN
jgi:phosphate transport system permease protein